MTLILVLWVFRLSVTQVQLCRTSLNVVALGVDRGHHLDHWTCHVMNCSGTVVQLKFYMPDTQWGQTDWNVRVCSRERFMAGPSKKNRWFMLKRPELPGASQGQVFLKANLGKGLQGVWLSSDWLVVRKQESHAQPEQETESHVFLLGGSSCKRTHRY